MRALSPAAYLGVLALVLWLPRGFALDRFVTVDDGALRSALRLLFDRMKLVAEPSAAITVAALLEGLVAPSGPTVAVLSGGNIEWDGVAALLAEP